MPGELEASADDHSPIQVESETAVSNPGANPFHGPPRSAEVYPVKDPGQGREFMDRGMNRPPNRTGGTKHRLHPTEPGPCCGATHLCQVGTSPRDRSVEIELPQGEVAAEIDHRHPKPAIGGHETAPRTQNEPWSTVGGEQVEYPLKPVSTTTSDQQICRPADAKRGPGAQIDPLMDLRVTAFAEFAEVLFEARGTVLHESNPSV